MIVFQAVVVAVCVVAALVAIAAFVRSRDMYERIGRLGSFWLASEEDQEGPPSPREIDEMRAAVLAARRRRQAKMAGGRRDPNEPQQMEPPPRA